MANTLLSQISALKKIAGDGSDPLIGEYADKIRESANDLVSTLQTVHERYTKVASALGGWEPDLVTAQAMSLKALNEAEGPYQQLQFLNGPTISAPQTSPPTPAQQQAAATHKTAVTKAQNQLNDAINDLQKAVQFRDDRANYWAEKINSASDDSLKDSWWDSFCHWVSEHADILKEIATILQDIAVCLAVLCLLIPGVDLLILAAMAVTAMMLVVHTMLAATGNGNWLDVGLDILGLLTLGMGLGAASEVEALEGTAREAATEAWESGAKELLEENKPVLQFFRSFTGEDGELTKIGQLGVKNTLGRVALAQGAKPEAAEESLGFWEKTAAQFKGNWNTWGSLDKVAATFTHGADPGIAEGMDGISGLAKLWPGAAKVTDALASGNSAVRWANVAFYGGNAVTIGDFVTGKALGDSYDQWKVDVSSYTLSTPMADALVATGNPLFTGFSVASSFIGN